MTCRHCGHSISYAPAEEAAWENSPCLRATCQGAYAPQSAIEDYYGDLYRSGDVVRIRTAEHTGLLEREVREWVENRFMARPPERRTTDPNLLSCTPTLEMGVNIGDLSSVILCAVPPATSNYVQRVGRAGRKEGAAVSLTIASAQPHDLYYFQLPEDMMAGEIQPPGTFLNAPAVLERQFTAFCFDRWSEQTNPKPILPHKIDAVLDVVRNPEGKAGFPYDFFKFVEANLESLLAGFVEHALAGALHRRVPHPVQTGGTHPRIPPDFRPLCPRRWRRGRRTDPQDSHSPLRLGRGPGRPAQPASKGGPGHPQKSRHDSAR